MAIFKLDETLARDCFVLGELEVSRLLLMNNSLLPWFILVPRIAEVNEIIELDADTQLALLAEINRLSNFLQRNFAPDKLNLAAIGNIVRQLHVHVVARRKDDYCWPGVVWGATGKQAYRQHAVDEILQMLEKDLDGFSRKT